MFYSLTGKVLHTGLSYIVIECGGVGFKVQTSNNTLFDISGEKTATVYTHLNVREDALDLFGFSTESELEWFRMLISVNGVGPKAALAILSQLPTDKLALAITAGDTKAITKAPGIGPKIANRIILDLKDKVGKSFSEGTVFSADDVAVAKATSSSNMSEAIAALTMLGYSQSDAASAVSKIDPDLRTEDIIRQALKLMS